MKSSLVMLLICVLGLSFTKSGAFTSNVRSQLTRYPFYNWSRDAHPAKNHPFIAVLTRNVAHQTRQHTMMLLALPTCIGRTTDLVRLGGMSALIGLSSQGVFTRFFRRFDKNEASYTAHSLVALIFMVLLSLVGSIGWWNHGIFPSTPMDRLLAPNDQCRWLATIVTGMLTFWDLPTSLSIPRLRKPDVMAHHLIMSITAYVAAVYLPMFYVFFYLGVSEISSIPLIIYDQLNVWTSNTASLSTTVPNSGSEPDYGVMNEGSSALILTRTVFQILAAVCFTLIRAIAFSYITLRYFIPDVLHVLAQSPSRTPVVTALQFALGASIGFTALQLYWFSLMVKTILGQSPQ